MDKKILILGNMANDGYAIAKPMQDMGVDVTLGVNNFDFGMSMPEWETEEFDDYVDPYDLDRKPMMKKEPPKWIRGFEFTMNLRLRPKSWINRVTQSLAIRKMCREYDLVEAQVPFSIITQFTGIPTIIYDAGWIRNFENRRSIIDRIGERGYNKARRLIITNPDTFRITDSLSTLKQPNIDFSPFAIDSDHYKPSESDIPIIDKSKFNIFAPARHVWNIKGNDRLIKAFARLVNYNPNVQLIFIAWSDDLNKSLELCRVLGISDKVIWLPPVPKPTLIKFYNAVDVVADQFILGSWGTLTPEAMSCEKPVLIYYSEKYIKRAFGELPPLPSISNENEIYDYLVTLLDKKERIKIGKKNREWIKKTHNPKKVAQIHINIWKKELE